MGMCNLDMGLGSGLGNRGNVLWVVSWAVLGLRDVVDPKSKPRERLPPRMPPPPPFALAARELSAPPPHDSEDHPPLALGMCQLRRLGCS